MSATDGLLGSTEANGLVADDLRTTERLARTLIAARDEYKTLVANPESLSSDIKAAATRCMRAGNAFFDEAATPERILSMVEGARDEKLHDALTYALAAKVKAQEKLLVAYRTGSHRVADSALTALEKADKMLADATAAIEAEAAARAVPSSLEGDAEPV